MAIEAIIRLARVPFARCSAAFLLSIPIALAACNTPGRKEMQVLNDRAQEQLVAGDVAEAEETVAKMLAIEYSRPNQRAEALLHGIRFYWNVADAERAITTCREAAALAGVEPVVRGTILVECGTLIKDVGDLREAEDLFLKLGDMEASHPAHRAMGYINLGELHLALGERHKALDDFRKGAALTHVHPHHRTSMQLQTAEILSAEGRLGEAAEVFEQLAEFPATSRDAKATALLRLAETWDELGDERRERATLRKVIQIEGVSRNHTITARRRLAAVRRQLEFPISDN